MWAENSVERRLMYAGGLGEEMVIPRVGFAAADPLAEVFVWDATPVASRRGFLCYT